MKIIRRSLSEWSEESVYMWDTHVYVIGNGG
jgi:hypothetical protein